MRLLSIRSGEGIQLLVFRYVLVETRGFVVARLGQVKESLALVSEEEDVEDQRVKCESPDQTRDEQVHVNWRFVLEGDFFFLAETVRGKLFDKHVPL